jgi:hypothetical protein
VELTVVDETNEPVHPLIIGRALAGGHREEQLDGHYAVAVPAGDQVLRLESPKDHRLGLLPGDDENGDVAARAYLPVDVRVHVPRAGRIVRAVQMRRAALIWVRQGAKSTRPGARTLAEATAGGARLFRAGTEIEGAFHRLDEDSGLVALVEPGEYVVQGPVGTGIMNAEVVAKAAEVTEVWLRGGSEK